MKKFLPVLALVSCLCGPLACQQKDNEVTPAVDSGQKIESVVSPGDKTDLDEVKPPVAPVCMKEENNAAPMSSDHADHILLELESMDSSSNLITALNTAGYDYANVSELFDNMTAGNFPGRYASPRLLKFFEVYDSEFANKVAAVREAKNDHMSEDVILSAKNFATLRLVTLLDIVFLADAKGRETNTEFSIGDVDYNWDVTANAITVSRSLCNP